ncbi:hypothetical protein R6Q59_036720 [Mikania micrantha]
MSYNDVQKKFEIWLHLGKVIRVNALRVCYYLFILAKESGPCINQLRFNSNHDLLAVATGKKIYVLLIELENEMVSVTKEANLEGHAEVVKSICWDIRGRYLASVSRDGARVWASTNDVWKSEYELESGGYPFQSCLFHPTHPQLLVISSY